MIDKRVPDFDTALAGMTDGATIMSSGFGAAGAPQDLLEAVLDRGWRDLIKFPTMQAKENAVLSD